jgi:Immunity protein 52
MVQEEAMNQIAFDYSISSDLPVNSESPASIGAKFVEALDALTRIDPTVFTNWEVMDLPAIASLPLAAARSRIADIIENNVSRDDLREPDPDSGYSAVAYTDKVIESRRISLRIHTGGNYKGDAWLQAGEWNVPTDLAIVTYPIFRKALLALNKIWPPPWACVNAFRTNYYNVPLFPGAPLFPYSRFHMPWIGYLSAPLAAGIELPIDIQTERMSNGGLLMIATEDRLDPTNPEHLRRARVIAETMMARTGYSSSKPAPRR